MKLRRLAGIGLTELTDRSRQKATQWVDRLAPALGVRRRPEGGLSRHASPAGEARAMIELFRDAAPRRFFPGIETGDAAEILRDELPAACRDIVSVANTACGRKLDLLGYEGLSIGEHIDWHLDPVSLRRAPLRHWSRLDLGNSSHGDPKIVWELNRHQWFIPLAQAYWLTADRRYAQETADLVDDWSRANPQGMGINWSSSLEVSYRLIAWTWTFLLTRDAGVLSIAEFAGFLAQIRAHAAHIERYLSRYFSPNTHLTGEALGLFYAGVLFPELREAARWRRLGLEILISESDRQILDDGVYFERATAYQLYTIEIYLHFLILAERNDVPVPVGVRGKVERLIESLLALSTPMGTMPQIGDADGGSLLPLARREAGDWRGVLAVAAALFERGDFLWAAGGPAPEVLWLLGTRGWDRLRCLKSEPPAAPASVAFRNGGFVVQRSGWERQAHQLVIDAGPLGCSLSAGHGHADLLSIQCAAFGEPFIVDPGTYRYAADPEWRDYFRSTAAHSTVLVDGLPQTEPRGPFGWRSQPAAAIRAWASSADTDFVDAFHDAYARLPDPVRHRRRVLFVKPRFWVVVDDLTGAALHDVELRFQFAPKPVRVGPGTSVAVQGRRGEGVWVSVQSTSRLVLTINEGQVDPPSGWVSPHYGRRRPAPMAIFLTRAELPLRLVTVIQPVEAVAAAPPIVEMVLDAADAIAGLRLAETGEFIRIGDDVLERA